MKSLIILLSIPLSFFSISANSAVGDVTGNTTCTIIKSITNLDSRVVPCAYKGIVEASMNHTLSKIDYELSTGEMFSTVDSANFNYDNKDSVGMLGSKQSINDLPVNIIQLHHKTFKLIPESEINERFKPDVKDYSDVLHCFKLTNHNEAFCVPYELTPSIS